MYQLGERTLLRRGSGPGSLYVDFGLYNGTLPKWSEVRQTDGSLVIRDRLIARVAAPFPNRARTVARASQARILQGRASN